MDDYLRGITRLYRFNGTVLIAQKGDILLQKGYGWKNHQTGVHNDENSIYAAAGLTQPLTAAVILQLQEQGKLSIHDKLSVYYPDYPPSNTITLQHLLTHTSGIADYLSGVDYDMAEDSAILVNPVSKELIFSLFQDKPLQFAPGTQTQYSHSGYFLLGNIIEKVTGLSWYQNVRDNILRPLQMTHSGFDYTHLPDTNKTMPYVLIDPMTTWKAYTVDSTVTNAAASLYTTVGDLYKWVGAADAKGDAYGWDLHPVLEKKAKRYSSHLWGYQSHILCFPEEEVVIIILANTFTANIEKTVTDLARIIFNK
jgi:CubicO group peptidase (beta-lactamase class C family)